MLADAYDCVVFDCDGVLWSGGETVALYAHGAVLVLGKVLEPSVRRRAAAVFLDAAIIRGGIDRQTA